MAERSFEALYRRRKVGAIAQRAVEGRAIQQWPAGPSRALDAAASPPHPANLDLHPESLVRTIEGDVIPRLMLALTHLQSPAAPAVPNFLPTCGHVNELVSHCLSPDDVASQHYVQRMYARGMALDAIYLQLVAPAARRLGELWVDDTVDFTDVTVGLARLHAVLRRFSPTFRMSRDASRLTPRDPQTLRRVLLAPAPGDQHTLGCVMIEDYFSRAGWDVLGWPMAADKGLVELVRSDYYQLAGLSVSCEKSLPAVQQLIAALRRASRNPSLIVMVGGRAFTESPQLAQTVGADLTGASGCEAVGAAEAALAQRLASS